MTELDLAAELPPIDRDGSPVYAMIYRDGRNRRIDVRDLMRLLAALPVETRDEVIKRALGIGGLGGFETDPRDSAALLELRQVIDDELGWESEEQEEEADYVGRVREVAKRWKEAEDAVNGERSLAAEATQRAERAEALAKSANTERYAALNEMAKARDKAQDAQLRYDFLCFDQEEVAEERGGQFARLWGKLKEAVRRAERAEARVKQLTDGVDYERRITNQTVRERDLAEARAKLAESESEAKAAKWEVAFREELMRREQAESALSTATARIAELEAESAWRAIEWDDPSTYPPEPKLVLVVLKLAGNDKPLVSQATWEAEREMWLDIETDGQNDHIEWAPGEVTHWRPMPKPPEKT